MDPLFSQVAHTAHSMGNALYTLNPLYMNEITLKDFLKRKSFAVVQQHIAATMIKMFCFIKNLKEVKEVFAADRDGGILGWHADKREAAELNVY